MTSSKNGKEISVLIPNIYIEDLRKLAFSHGISLNKLIRDISIKYCNGKLIDIDNNIYKENVPDSVQYFLDTFVDICHDKVVSVDNDNNNDK